MDFNSLINYTTSDCDILPSSWTHVTTDVKFPVKFGSEVTVKCSDGYSKTSGDDVVTCQGDGNYKHISVPVCKKGLKEYFIRFISINIISTKK